MDQEEKEKLHQFVRHMELSQATPLGIVTEFVLGIVGIIGLISLVFIVPWILASFS